MSNRRTKKRTKAKSPPPAFEGDPTPERLARADGEVWSFTTESGRKTKRLSSILDLMLSRGIIDTQLYEAGMKAYAQWYYGGLAPIGAVDHTRQRVDGGGRGDPMQRRLDNARKYAEATQALSKAHRRAFEVLVLHEIPVAVFGREYYGYNTILQARAVAYATLRDALAALDVYYTGHKTNTAP